MILPEVQKFYAIIIQNFLKGDFYENRYNYMVEK